MFFRVLDKKLIEKRQEKLNYAQGMWNTAAVTYGGLGNDPLVTGKYGCLLFY